MQPCQTKQFSGWACAAVAVLTVVCSASTSGHSKERVLPSGVATITIDASSNDGPATPLIGFVHGIAAPSGADYDFPPETAARIAALKPTLWKVSDPRHYLKAKPFGAQIMYASSDQYFRYQEIYYPWNDTGTKSGRFDDWANFDANAISVLQRSLTWAQPVDYWGILNEPQFVHYAAADRKRLMQTYKHGYHDFKDGHPEQKVVAPTTIGYSHAVMKPFLDHAAASDLRFDAIDWHELGSRPEDVVDHANDLRALLAARPGLGSPPIIIDEYASAEQHHLPGFAVAWFYYLEQARVFRAARACWNMQDKANGIWSDCWDGLDGLFMKDNSTPQALYWVFERYAQMRGRKLNSTSSEPSDVVALARGASIGSQGTGEIMMLVGRFVSDSKHAGAAARDVVIHIEKLPLSSGNVHILVQHIPYLGPDVLTGSDPIAVPLARPEPAASRTVAVVRGQATIVLPAFQDRDAYYINVKQLHAADR